jgi:F-type H+-transporting ATPase subunit a
VSKAKLAIFSIVALVLIIAIRILLPFEIPPIKIAAEQIPGWVIPIPGFSIPVTNSLLATWLAMLLLIVAALWIRRDLRLVPTGRQNAAEMIIEALYNLTESIASPKWAPTFFPIIATIFLFVLLSNLLDPLTPLLAAVGIKHNGEIIPLLRSPSTDLNFTVGLALISVVLTQYFGIRAQGLRYFSKFINFGGFIKFARILLGKAKGSAGGALFFAFIDLFMGLIELISEFAKILSFSFRLFGNLFAGEVLLLVIPFLVSFLIPLLPLGLELFVGVIQAFVFAVLTLAFMSMATISHGGEGEHAAH